MRGPWQFLVLLAAVGSAARAAEFTLESAEAQVHAHHPAAVRPSTAVPPGVGVEENVTYARVGDRDLQLDLYRPAAPGPHPAVLLVHGGGWESGDRRMERAFALHLAALGYVGVPVSYRLGAAGRFPAPVHDLKAAVRWLRAHAADHGIDPHRIALVGGSAGGQLAALVGASNGDPALEGAEGVTNVDSDVQAVVDIDGLADFTGPELLTQQEKAPSAPTRFLGGTFAERSEVWREASALFHVGPRSAPVLFICSTAPTPILPGRAAMRERLEAAGVDAEMMVEPDTPHPFWLFEPWFSDVVAATNRFLARRFAAPAPAAVGSPSAAEIRTAMHRVFADALAHPLVVKPDDTDGRHGWINGALYTGVMAAGRATGDPSYHDAAVAWAEASGWQTGPRPRHADDQCCAQTYLELFQTDGGPEKYAAFRRDADAMLAAEAPGRKDWWWCDALFMAPPAFARLAEATGDPQYRQLLHRMYWDTVDFLYDPAESLFFRDGSFLPGQPAAGGRKIFWSRGNGWVFAGLARVIDHLPPDDPQRPRYVTLFQKMAARLRDLQQPAGFWPSDLTAPENYPGVETSGTAFFGFGLAWGVNRGLLDRAEYEPAALRAWRCLNTAVDASGRLGFVQPVGFKPGPAGPGDTRPYAVGGFLLLGSELLAGTR